MNRCVLVVEDSGLVLNTIAVTLHTRGFEVISALDGDEALLQLERELPTLVITDLKMPNRGGLDLVLAIRDDERYAQLPVLVLTGADPDDDERRTVTYLKGVRVMEKPYAPEELLDEITSMLAEVAR
jgi:DNA-binding response OmpR family regulator